MGASRLVPEGVLLDPVPRRRNRCERETSEVDVEAAGGRST
jgi:hypothetical protein